MQSFLEATSAVGRVAKWILNTLAVLFFAGLTILPALQIILRLLRMPFIGAEELTRFFLICMIFLSYPLVVAAKENIVMGEFKAAFPVSIRKTLDVLIDLSALCLNFFIAYATYHTVFRNLKNVTPTLEIPFWIFLASTFVAFSCSGIIHLGDFLARIFAPKLAESIPDKKNVAV